MNSDMTNVVKYYPPQHSNFFGGHTPHEFSKAGSTEWIFFFKKKSLGNKLFAKINVFGAEILPRLERNGPKMLNFSKNRGHKN